MLSEAEASTPLPPETQREEILRQAQNDEGKEESFGNEE